MRNNRGTSLSIIIAERFATDWKLLSETEAYLSHTPDFPEYEAQFMAWRARLQDSTTTEPERDELRKNLIALRKELRLRGYDLSLGLQRLVVKGFRNDDALADGFRRVVICFCDSALYFQTGSANHVEIAGELFDTLSRKRLLREPETHYLWYLRNSKGLILSGSATERDVDFARLESRAEANPLKILSALKELA